MSYTLEEVEGEEDIPFLNLLERTFGSFKTCYGNSHECRHYLGVETKNIERTCAL